MAWLFLGLAVAIVVFLAFRRARETREPARPAGIEFRTESRTRALTSSKPDDPRFATWEEAMNRPVTDDLHFWIEYQDRDGVITEREIRPKMIRLQAHQPDVLIVAHCYLRNEERDFWSARILAARNLRTGRAITDLGQYLRRTY